MKRLLITGGAGFVGSHLTKFVFDRGYAVLVLERESADLSVLPDGVDVELGEFIDDQARLETIMRAWQPEVLVHTAAIVRAVPESRWVLPLVRTNVLLGTLLLQIGVDNGVRRFVGTGSYWQSKFSADHYDPVNLYAATKQAFADIVKYYAGTQRMEAVTLKLFGNYGPGDNRPNLFSALAEAIESTAPISMTTGEQSIDLVHIEDVCRAFEAAIVLPSIPSYQECEIGTGTTATIRQIATWYESACGKPLNLSWGDKVAGNDFERPASVQPAYELLGWKPSISIQGGVSRLASMTCAEYSS